MIKNLALFVEGEKLCCPFFSFTIEIKSGNENLVLKIAGKNGIKNFIQAEFESFLPAGISFSK